jgi:uncharacterized protein (TIGR03435 family)
MRVTLVTIVLAAGIVHAQAPPVAFEVASVKQSPPLDPTGFMVRPGSADPGGRWSARNSTLLMLLKRAYPDFDKPGMIVGGPGWLDERRFDIDATAAGNPTTAQYPPLVQRLLADRFKLKARVEPRPVEVYALVVARADGRLGARLRPASPECLAELEAERVRIKNATGPVTFSSSDVRPCKGGLGDSPSGLFRMAGGATLESIAFGLQVFMNKRVVDRTSLQGIYEYELEFDYNATRSIASTSDDNPAGGSVFTAVQEQLGLKLERRRETLDVLVIDSVEMPSEN